MCYNVLPPSDPILRKFKDQHDRFCELMRWAPPWDIMYEFYACFAGATTLSESSYATVRNYLQMYLPGFVQLPYECRAIDLVVAKLQAASDALKKHSDCWYSTPCVSDEGDGYPSSKAVITRFADSHRSLIKRMGWGPPEAINSQFYVILRKNRLYHKDAETVHRFLREYAAGFFDLEAWHKSSNKATVLTQELGRAATSISSAA